MRKRIQIGLVVCGVLLAIAGPALWYLARSYQRSLSGEAGKEKLENIFGEHQIGLPEEYSVAAYDYTPGDFQGKSDQYYELEISDDDFLEVLNTTRTEKIDKDFAALADACDYREENEDGCFERGTVLDRAGFFEADCVKYDRTDSFSTLFMWYEQETGILHILHSDG